jgi:hypothetical protein
MTLDLAELISRADSAPRRFSAMLHEWTDQDAQVKLSSRLMEQSAEMKPVRGLGRFS